MKEDLGQRALAVKVGSSFTSVSWVENERHIAPLNADADEFKGVPVGWISDSRDAEQRREATRKLRQYFRRMGFERIRGTRFHGLSMARIVPSLADLLRRKS